MTVPNLDDDQSIDLMDFWNKHQNGRNFHVMFPRGGRGTKKATADLANYASNRHAAQGCRRRGEIESAKMYENICDKIFMNLPKWARW